MQAEVKGKRAEQRKFLKVGVDLCGLDVRTPAHSGVTDNVSPYGARVLTIKRTLHAGELQVKSPSGLLRADGKRAVRDRAAILRQRR
jgi:hypothetical protein